MTLVLKCGMTLEKLHMTVSVERLAMLSSVKVLTDLRTGTEQLLIQRRQSLANLFHHHHHLYHHHKRRDYRGI